MIEDRVIAAIALHTENDPVLSKDLEKQFNITGPQLREIIHKLRMAPHYKPIATHEKGGYFMAKTRPQLEPTLRSIRGRKNSLTQLEESLEHTLLGLPGL